VIVALLALVPPPAQPKKRSRPPHLLAGQKLVPQDVDWEHPIYQTSFDGPAVLKDWRVEGGKSMHIADGKLILESQLGSTHSEPKANHLVGWLAKEVPGDYLKVLPLTPSPRPEQPTHAEFRSAPGPTETR
jgi:hypothetical protein